MTLIENIDPAVYFWLFIASAVMFILGLLALPVVAILIPEDYFVTDECARPRPRRHPVLHALILIARNVFGAALLLAGVVMLFTPGQGLLSILVGLMLLTIPGKRRVIAAIIARPKVLAALNLLRARFNHPPLRVPPDDCKRGDSV
jgi:hypothetical protein